MAIIIRDGKPRIQACHRTSLSAGARLTDAISELYKDIGLPGGEIQRKIFDLAGTDVCEDKPVRWDEIKPELIRRDPLLLKECQKDMVCLVHLIKNLGES